MKQKKNRAFGSLNSSTSFVNHLNRAFAPSNRKKCWQVKNLSDGDVEILLYDEIGFWGASADTFVRDIKSISAANIHLRINSPGGDIFDGLAIHNAIADHPANVIAHVDGLAASTASWIAMAANEVRMPKTSYLMIHDPMAFTAGGSGDLRKTADLLDKLKSTIANVYAERSGEKVQKFLDAMTAETWYDGQEAKDAGLADVVENDETQVSNRFDLSRYRNVPANLRGVTTNGPAKPSTLREAESALRDVGLSNSEARKIAPALLDALHRDDAATAGTHRDDADLAEAINAFSFLKSL